MRHVSSIVPGLSADVQQLYWAKDALLAGSDALIHPPEGKRMRHVSSIVPGLSADVQQLYWAKDALLAGSDASIHPHRWLQD
ncbi:MAG: hypothetical protein M1493_08185 [Firmicutes bacterium]|nr:hypothetical protein [Bacillota bacterium]